MFSTREFELVTYVISRVDYSLPPMPIKEIPDYVKRNQPPKSPKKGK